MNYTYIAPFDKNDKRLVHKFRCTDKPPPHECMTAAEGSNKEQTLSNAKSQIPSDAAYIELCKKCWP